MRYHTVVFDLDGTLLNTLDDLWISTNHALGQLGYPQRSRDEVRRFVGNGLYNLMRQALPEGSAPAEVQRALDCQIAHYDLHCEDHTAPYPGIPELMRELRARGAKVAVVSNKADSAVQILMPHYFAGLYDSCCGEREGVRRKPAPDALLEVMRELEANPASTVYVGDSEVDVATAQAAALPCVSVTWGFRTVADLEAAGATAFARTPEELLALL